MRRVVTSLVRTLMPVAALILSLPAPAQDAPPANPEALDRYLTAIQSDLAARRDAALRTLMEMDATESETFWSLKSDYDQQLAELAARRRDLIRDFAKVYDRLTPEIAAPLAKRTFGLEQDRISLHRKYFDIMAERVSPGTAARFLQLQGQFETMALVKVFAAVPLASHGEESDAAAQAAKIQEFFETMKGDLIPARDTALAELVKLDGDEAREFDALKSAHDKEEAKIRKERRKLLADYKRVYQNFTADEARALSERLFQIEDERLALRRKYLDLMTEKVGVVPAVQFFQVQSRFETMADLQAATYVPLAVD
ncbi:MAG: hypothetical protein PVF68_06135 [Acidobacteriota bacterium]